MNKVILLIVPVLTLLTTATTQHQQKVAYATPYITNFGNGYADGKHERKIHFIQADTVMQAARYLSGITYRIAHMT